MALRLKGSSSGSVALDVPSTVSGGDVTLVLPNGVGSANQVLKNSGTAGTLEFGSAGKVVQIVQSVQDAVYSVSWSTNGSIVSMPSDFNVSMTPVSRSNYFLIECCWYVGVLAQTNVGWAIKENSSGTAAYIKETDGSTQIKNTQSAGTDWPSGNANVMWSYGPGYSTGNDERQEVTVTKYLTKLGTTSGSGSVTWSFDMWGGETSPLHVNRGGVSSTNTYAFPCVSTTTVTEIQA